MIKRHLCNEIKVIIFYYIRHYNLYTHRNMNQTLFRQLKDIQLQAEKLLSGDSDEEAFVSFSNYNNELKSYLLQNCDDATIRSLVNEIPEVLDVKQETSKPLVLLIILGLVTLGISAFYFASVANMRQTRLIQENIHTVRGKYASIEFLMKANL